MSPSNRWVVVAAVIGILFFTIGIFVYSIAPDYLQKRIKMGLPLQETSPMWETWVEPSVPIYVQFYFFDVLNPDEITKGDLPVRLNQLGPYTFRKRLVKTNITFDDENGTVSYVLRKWFVFEPSLSDGDLDDNITTVNIPLMSFGKKTEGLLPKSAVMLFNKVMKKNDAEVFTHRTIGQLLFEGYVDKFLKFLSGYTGVEYLPDGRFGFFYKLNGTGQTFLVDTGVENQSRLAILSAWSKDVVDATEIRSGDYKSLSFWSDKFCDAINGTDGSRFPAPVTKNNLLRIFADELCRSIYVRFEEETEVYGIPTLRFTLPEELMANSSDNLCFCSGQEPNCLGSGMLNVSVCRKGAPIVLSPAHFYRLDASYADVFPDLAPSEDLITFLDVEPMTGLVLRAAKKLQVNVFVRHYPNVHQTEKLQQLVFPVFWVNESVEITPDKAGTFRTWIVVLPRVLNYTSLAFLGLGAVILLLAIECALVKCCRKASTSTHTHTKLKPTPALPAAHFVKVPPNKSVSSSGSSNAILDSEEVEETTSGL